MELQFYKYQGTGNDFIMLDNRFGLISLEEEQIKFLCNRNYGIGADGLIILELEPGLDFKMNYYNCDGKQSTMCGNGGRCITAFAKFIGVISEHAKFIAIDGIHESIINEDGNVALKMQDVKQIEMIEKSFYLNTGSPHFVEFVEKLSSFDVLNEGKKIRNGARFCEEGTNVNFIEKIDEDLFVRTYERGVEKETLSCGTGAVAVAIVASIKGISSGKNNCIVKTLGGNLEITFEKVLDQNFYNIWLKGMASFVYKGLINL